MNQDTESKWLDEAIRLSIASVEAGQGGPFGAVVVRDEAVVGRGSNLVTSTCDPTAHAEVVAIRHACRTLEDFQLAGCTLYASCEPCPMCLSAAHWARVDRVVFAADRHDAARAGFDDAHIYEQLALPPGARRMPVVQLPRPTALRPFEKWREWEGRVEY